MENGEWTSDNDKMKEVVVSYFQQLFQRKSSDFVYKDFPLGFSKINEEEKKTINKMVQFDKVKRSLDGIGGLKAPEPYGFPTLFYKKNWNVCKADLYNLAIECFREGRVSRDINQTFIALIPNITSP
ncbi:hypothetical protein ACOSP7_006933 [Xanthoceras sorbifolium]